MKAVAIVLVILGLAGCAPIASLRVEPGVQTIGERLSLKIDGAWNYIRLPGGGPSQTWTMEGLPIDQLLIYGSLQDGQPIHAVRAGVAPQSDKPLTFRSSMQPDEIVGLFDGMFSRDGSDFKLSKLQPTRFAGDNGFQFEYALIRKVDNVRLQGLGYAAVRRGELFAIIYQAPRLAFFDRHVARVKAIADSAAIKD